MDLERLSAIFQGAPAFAKLGFTVPDPTYRERAAEQFLLMFWHKRTKLALFMIATSRLCGCHVSANGRLGDLSHLIKQDANLRIEY